MWRASRPMSWTGSDEWQSEPWREHLQPVGDSERLIFQPRQGPTAIGTQSSDQRSVKLKDEEVQLLGHRSGRSLPSGASQRLQSLVELVVVQELDRAVGAMSNAVWGGRARLPAIVCRMHSSATSVKPPVSSRAGHVLPRGEVSCGNLPNRGKNSTNGICSTRKPYIPAREGGHLGFDHVSSGGRRRLRA